MDDRHNNDTVSKNSRAISVVGNNPVTNASAAQAASLVHTRSGNEEDILFNLETLVQTSRQQDQDLVKHDGKELLLLQEEQEIAVTATQSGLGNDVLVMASNSGINMVQRARESSGTQHVEENTRQEAEDGQQVAVSESDDNAALLAFIENASTMELVETFALSHVRTITTRSSYFDHETGERVYTDGTVERTFADALELAINDWKYMSKYGAVDTLGGMIGLFGLDPSDYLSYGFSGDQLNSSAEIVDADGVADAITGLALRNHMIYSLDNFWLFWDTWPGGESGAFYRGAPLYIEAMSGKNVVPEVDVTGFDPLFGGSEQVEINRILLTAPALYGEEAMLADVTFRYAGGPNETLNVCDTVDWRLHLPGMNGDVPFEALNLYGVPMGGPSERPDWAIC